MENSDAKKTWGGARHGAGRKSKGVKPMSFNATPEVVQFFSSFQGNKSQFICDCIIKAIHQP